MSGRRVACVLLAAVAGVPLARARAQGTPEGPVILRNGVNAVALLGDSTPGQVMVSWRGNYNAHGYSVVLFSLRAPSDLGDAPVWQDVPFFGGPRDGDTGREIFRTSEGADCTLGDLRVVPHHAAPVEVILASRALGASFADTAAVRFDYYRLVRNDQGDAGWPPFYFRFVRSAAARHGYCDVNDAFRRELGLGDVGLGHGEGGRQARP